MLKVRVQNFQSIADVTLEIEGFTVLTGDNNVGKSALFRALRGVFTNPPSSFVRKGCKHSTVELWSGENYVKWEKGKGVNCYTLHTEQGEFLFEKPGPHTPPEVCKAFGVDSVMLGDRKTWPQFADQFTGPVYLLDQPGHILADVVASPERMQVLGKALSSAEKGRRKAASTLKVKREDQTKLDSKLVDLSGFDACSASVDALEKTRAKALHVREGHGKLQRLQEAVVSTAAELERWAAFQASAFEEVPDVAGLRSKLGTLQLLQERIRETQADLNGLEGVPSPSWVPEGVELLEKLRELRKLRTAYLRSQKILLTLEGFKAASFEEDPKASKILRGVRLVTELKRRLEETEKARLHLPALQMPESTAEMEELLTLRDRVRELRECSDQVHSTARDLEKLGRKLEETREELRALEEDLPERECPLCGSLVKEKTC